MVRIVVAVSFRVIDDFFQLQQKDMLLALDLGRRLGSPVPLAAAANEMMNACRGLGIDHNDFVTAHEVYRRLGGQSK